MNVNITVKAGLCLCKVMTKVLPKVKEQLKKLYPAYLNERVCQRWLEIMGVESIPERRCPKLHDNAIASGVEKRLVRILGQPGV